MVFTTIDPSLTPTVSQNINNILDNAGFDVWQRGTSLNVGGGGQVTADRWNYPGITGGAATISKETTVTHNSAASLKFNITNTGSATIAYLFESIENYQDYAGKTVSFSCWVNTTMSNVRIGMQNGTVTSAAHPGDGQWHQLTVTTTLATNITFFNAFTPFIPAGSLAIGIVYVDSAMLVVGSNAIEHVPTPPEVDLARCQRYYYRFGQGAMIGGGQCFSTSQAAFVLRFPVQMRISPTLNVVGVSGSNFQMSQSNSSATNVTATSTGSATPDAFQLVAQTGTVLTAGNATYLFSNTTSAYIEASAEI